MRTTDTPKRKCKRCGELFNHGGFGIPEGGALCSIECLDSYRRTKRAKELRGENDSTYNN
jgi:hypothetical protein